MSAPIPPDLSKIKGGAERQAAKQAYRDALAAAAPSPAPDPVLVRLNALEAVASAGQALISQLTTATSISDVQQAANLAIQVQLQASTVSDPAPPEPSPTEPS